MNKKLLKTLKVVFWYAMFDALLLGYFGLIPGATTAAAQTLLPMTTTAAVQTRSITNVNLTSLTNVTLLNTYLYIDQELEQVVSIPATGTIVGVVRAQGGTQGHQHNSGATVFIITPAASANALVTADPQGACARGSASLVNGVLQAQSTLYLPIINTRTGVIFDCLGGIFVGGDFSLPPVTQYRIPAPSPGGTAYTSLNSTGTTLAATTMYCTEIDLPYNKYITGLGFLLGTAGGTDKHIGILYDSAGNLLANSATAGTTAGTASTYEQMAFTTPYFAVGPAQYFGCLQTNGTTATVRMLVTGTQDTYLTKGVTGQTFGTIPATITVPTTFTTAVGPYEYVY